MSRNDRYFKEKDDKPQPESPEGLVYTAAKNRSFAEKLVGIIRTRLKEANHGRR